MTIQIHITEGAQATTEELRNAPWHPWLNCKSLNETSQLAANKHIRERGGIAVGAELDLNVYAKIKADDMPADTIVLTTFKASRHS